LAARYAARRVEEDRHRGHGWVFDGELLRKHFLLRRSSSGQGSCRGPRRRCLLKDCEQFVKPEYAQARYCSAACQEEEDPPRLSPTPDTPPPASWCAPDFCPRVHNAWSASGGPALPKSAAILRNTLVMECDSRPWPTSRLHPSGPSPRSLPEAANKSAFPVPRLRVPAFRPVAEGRDTFISLNRLLD
jgi:hypothetical protein